MELYSTFMEAYRFHWNNIFTELYKIFVALQKSRDRQNKCVNILTLNIMQNVPSLIRVCLVNTILFHNFPIELICLF